MNNSFARLIDGMNATLRSEVLPRLDDDFARGQVFGVINLLNTFKVRADWSPGFVMQQLQAQRAALQEVAALARDAGVVDGLPREPASLASAAAPDPLQPGSAGVGALLAQRDAGNRAIGEWLRWLDDTHVRPPAAAAIEKVLRAAMRAEVDVEIRNSPRPLFAEMSSGRGE